MKSNNEMVMEYIQTRNLKTETYYQLKTILNDYSSYQQTSLHELIIEAETEEDNGVRWKHRQLKKRLTSYMNNLIGRLSLTSCRNYLAKIKSFYYFHEIEIHKLPPFNERNIPLSKPITYTDLPDKKIIRTAVELSEPLMKAVILTMCTGGFARVDVLKLTIQDFINSTAEYHNETEITKVTEVLQKTDEPIIPVWSNRREKTNKYYITFTTPEATNETLNYLQLRLDNIRKYKKPQLQPNDRLFKISSDWLTRKFQDLNTIMGLGKVGSYNRFRSHMLRKYHSSNLSKAGMERSKINVLQGKSNGKVDDVYFFEDTEKLKEDYINVMHELLVFMEVDKWDSPEVLRIKKENQELKLRLEDLERLRSDVDKIMSWYKLG